jgi:CRP/FNR family transcriptional regulator, cyclic AMP receptor protein
MHARRKQPLLDLDPDLGALLPDDRLDAAHRELEVEVYRLPEGPWDAGGDGPNPEHVGLLLIEGVIARDVVVSDTVSTELLGPGDVVRPWSVHESPALLRLLVRWNALTESRVAVLDRRFGAQLARWPEVNAALIDRVNDRARRLATTQAISQLNRVDRRLLTLFWHLAERWGRMTTDGVAVPLTLSHRMLGQLVGARRPTVSTAIAELAERGELVRRGDGTWLLRGDPVGMPTEEAGRLVPIRRKLLGRLKDAGPGDEPPLPYLPPQAPAVATVLAELQDTITLLRSETRLHIDELEALAGRSRQLLVEAGVLRGRRDLDRRERTAQR